MAEYTDLAKIETLNKELAQVEQALLILDEYNGTVSQYTVAPVTNYATPTFNSMPVPMPPMAVAIITVDPGPELIAGVHSSLVERYNELIAELSGLGVTGGPPLREV